MSYREMLGDFSESDADWARAQMQKILTNDSLTGNKGVLSGVGFGRSLAFFVCEFPTVSFLAVDEFRNEKLSADSVEGRLVSAAGDPFQALLAHIEEHAPGVLKNCAAVLPVSAVEASRMLQKENLGISSVWLDMVGKPAFFSRDLATWWERLPKGGIIAGPRFTERRWELPHFASEQKVLLSTSGENWAVMK